MRGLAVLTVVFVFASGALFVGTSSAQSSGSLSGMICLAPHGSPEYGNSTPGLSCMYSQGLPGATVTLTPSGGLPLVGSLGGNPSATSDEGGAYSISNLPDGDYTFTVTRQGFKAASGSVTVSGATHRDVMLAGEPVDVSGRVVDPDRNGIANARVNLCCSGNGSHGAASGPDGRFALGQVPAGWYSIDVQAPGFQAFYDSRLVDGAIPDLRLERIPPQDGRITGTVVDQDGNPVADARVAVYSYGGCCYAYDSAPEMSYRPYYGGENFTFSDAQGRFSIGAYSGDNGLTVTKDGYAGQSRQVSVPKDGAATADVELLKFPEKTAKVVGQVVDARTGKGLAHAYVNLQSPEYGLYECSQPSGSGSGSGSPGSSGTASGSVAPQPAVASDGAAKSSMPAYYDPGCAIATRDDGTFEGFVSPGYAILSVWVDHYASCSESSDADGSLTRTCGPEYYSWSVSRVLPADATTTFDVQLRSRPAPDATVSGYVIDAETHQAIPGATISFSNQDTYGYGYATTDGDGSYRLRLRSGYHSVSVWAEGHLRWEGVLDVAKGDGDFDVEVQPGTESYGYCCPGPYYGGVAYASGDAASGKSAMSASATGTSAPNAAPMAAGDASREGAAQQGEQYEDLGGGLGPYDPAKRASELQSPSDGAPGLGLLAALAAIGAVLALRRRLA